MDDVCGTQAIMLVKLVLMILAYAAFFSKKQTDIQEILNIKPHHGLNMIAIPQKEETPLPPLNL